MPLNRDDIINEAPITGSRGITCNRIEMRIHPVTRNILVDFHLSKITVLADNTTFEEALMPISVDLSDGTGTKTSRSTTVAPASRPGTRAPTI